MVKYLTFNKPDVMTAHTLEGGPMKNLLRSLIFFLVYLSIGISTATAADLYYARCNLKVLKGSLITWINWQSAPTFVPAGTPLKVIKNDDKATLIDEKKGMEYQLDMGMAGDRYLEKFVSRNPVDLTKYSHEALKGIKNAVAKMGMTKEEVYIAMGPPTKVPAGDTIAMDYDDIMKYDLWIYARRRFGKNIGIGFHPETGTVNRTEGIWK